MPFISVVIPLYNKVDYIKRAVDSVLMQTFSDFELLVIDDGSTDGSFEQLAGYLDPRLKVIRQNNQGVSSARNSGVGFASADYVAFLDADDCYHSDFLERINLLISTNPNAVMYSCRFMLVDEDGKTFIPKGRLPRGFNGELPCFFAAFRQNRSLIHPSSMAVRKSVFLEVGGFPVGKAVGEDLQLMLLMALAGPVMTDHSIAATVFRNALNRTAQRYPTEVCCHIEYFLKTDDWRNIAPAKENALIDFVLQNTLIHVAGALLNNQRPLAKYYSGLLAEHSWRHALLAKLMLLLPIRTLHVIKSLRNHG